MGDPGEHLHFRFTYSRLAFQYSWDFRRGEWKIRGGPVWLHVKFRVQYAIRDLWWMLRR